MPLVFDYLCPSIVYSSSLHIAFLALYEPMEHVHRQGAAVLITLKAYSYYVNYITIMIVGLNSVESWDISELIQ